jgi:hypothetical protein
MKFYIIENHIFDDTKYAYGEQVDVIAGDFDKCEQCGSPVSMRKWLPPRKFKLSKPSYGDFVFGTFPAFLVSERFRKEYERSGLNGIVNFEDVEVVKIMGKRLNLLQPPRYFNVTIVRSKALIDEEKSKLIRNEEPQCNFCRTSIIKSFNGVFLSPNTWGGEDIFYARGLPGTIILSERFREFVLKHNFTNINLVPAEDYKINFYSSKV